MPEPAAGKMIKLHFRDQPGFHRLPLAASRHCGRKPQVGSLLLGLYNRQVQLDHVGFCSSITREERPALTHRSGPKCWITGKSMTFPDRWLMGQVGIQT